MDTFKITALDANSRKHFQSDFVKSAPEGRNIFRTVKSGSGKRSNSAKATFAGLAPSMLIVRDGEGNVVAKSTDFVGTERLVTVNKAEVKVPSKTASLNLDGIIYSAEFVTEDGKTTVWLKAAEAESTPSSVVIEAEDADEALLAELGLLDED